MAIRAAYKFGTEQFLCSLISLNIVSTCQFAYFSRGNACPGLGTQQQQQQQQRSGCLRHQCPRARTRKTDDRICLRYSTPPSMHTLTQRL